MKGINNRDRRIVLGKKKKWRVLVSMCQLRLFDFLSQLLFHRSYYRPPGFVYALIDRAGAQVYSEPVVQKLLGQQP